MLKTEDIRIRDPFILPFDGCYYLYGTNCLPDSEDELVVYCSENLNDWQAPKCIFKLPKDFWGIGELWAPEVHIYKDRFYMFVSILGKNGLRGTQIAVSNRPDGDFVPIADHPATPLDKSCIDGTLYVEDGQPYIVYSRDWPDNFVKEKNCFVGQIAAVKLTEDLCEQAEEPFLIFNSDEALYEGNLPQEIEWQGNPSKRYGSDAPFLQKLADGRLLLTWSPMPAGNYIVAAAVSESGSIRGEFKHIKQPIYSNNGGHAMFFEDFSGRKRMCIHYPERFPEERALILDGAELIEL